MNDIFTLSNLVDNTVSINEPLKHTQRIKYTAFDASTKYLTFGTTSGSLYLFSRKPCKFLHLIPNKHGPVLNLSISPEEKFISFYTQKGFICLYVINLSANSPPQVLTTKLDDDIIVTCLKWSSCEKQFYYGDNKGQVNLVTLSFFMGRNLLNISVHPILYLDSSIVQISEFESLLLVSNYSKCILCNTEYEEYKQIGNKPRDGEFGACFLISSNEHINPSRIYCARPGTRFWEVDFEGNVIQTHQFKQVLACPPTKLPINGQKLIIPIRENDDKNYEHVNGKNNYNNDNIDGVNEQQITYQPQNLQYSKLQIIHGEFILTFTNLAIYIFDIRQSKLILWSNDMNEISDCCVVDFDEIVIYEKTGAIYTVRLQLLQSLAIDLVQQTKFLDCTLLLKKNLKYFAEKSKEDYDLIILNKIKDYLIDTNEYEMLNDLSVIFDSITQAEDELSSGSGHSLTERKSVSSIGAGGGDASSNTSRSSGSNNYNNRNNDIDKSVYILENSFCDNLKLNTERDRQLKDALLTVTGKFGKNIIKYKFNIFNDEQKELVNDLIPNKNQQCKINDEQNPQQIREIPFQNVQLDDNLTEIVCRKSSSTTLNKKMNNKNNSNKNKIENSLVITDEEKIIYNLYLIYKTSKISNINFLERYSYIFDLYKSNEIINILNKLEIVMIENGDTEILAKINCYEMYFNYLNPELIYEFDKITIDFIINGFCLINDKNSIIIDDNNDDELIINCNLCNFPIRFNNTCRYHKLGEILIKYLWSRNEHEYINNILKKVPAMYDIMCRIYLNDNQLDKVIPIILNFGTIELLQESGKLFNLNQWDKCFQLFLSIQNGKYTCINCNEIISINVDRHFFYTWNCFLNLLLEFIKSSDLLDLILKYSEHIPNDAIESDFYRKCLIKSMEEVKE